MQAQPQLKVVDNAPSNTTPLNKKQLQAAYEQMLLLRRFEEKIASIYQQGLMGGFCHLYIGQEAVLTGCKLACPDDDYITSYRCHAHAIACGATPESVMAELMGRVTGISKGKGGSMHMFAPEQGFWGGHGIVAAQVPLGAGIAFANKYKENGRICLTFLGDAAMNAGQSFESLNIAALWELPALFIIENNHYGIGTKIDRSAAGELYKRAEPFGMACERVDGMDVVTVYEAVARARDHIKSTGKPYLIEMDTYRYRGHSMSDPAKYRTREEVDTIRDTRDPIERLGRHLIDKHGMSENALKDIDKAIKKQVSDAFDFASNSPEPPESALFEDIIPQ